MKNFLKIVLSIVAGFSYHNTFAAGPAEEYMRNIEVPSYRIENFTCLENCEVISFRQDEEIFHEASECPICEEIELTFQQPNDKGVFKYELYVLNRKYEYIKNAVYQENDWTTERFELTPDQECKAEIKYRDKVIALTLEPELDGNSCKTIVKSAECSEGNCTNTRLYTYEDISNYKERLLFSSCQNAPTCQGYNMSHGYHWDDYGVVLDYYRVNFENQSYDLNNKVGERRQFIQDDKILRIPVKDLKQTTTISDQFGDSVIQFDLVTDDFPLLEKALRNPAKDFIWPSLVVLILIGGTGYFIYKVYTNKDLK